MTIPFLSIPAHIGDRIVQKLDLLDFVNFSQVSRKSFHAAKNVKTRYTIDAQKKFKSSPMTFMPQFVLFANYRNKELTMETVVTKESIVRENFNDISKKLFYALPLRFEDCYIYVLDPFSEEFCSSFTEFVFHTYTSVKEIYMPIGISCSAEALERFITTGRIKKMQINQYLSSDFMEIKSIKDAAFLSLQDFVDETKIFALDVVNFTIESSNLSSAGANLILKELLAGKRKINDCTIKTNQSYDVDAVFKGIPILYRTSFAPGGVTVDIGKCCIFHVTIVNTCFSIRKANCLNIT